MNRARDALVEAGFAALVAGVVEAGFVAWTAGTFDLDAVLVIAALATLGALPLALVARAALAAIARVPLAARWGRDAMTGGGARTVAVWRALLAAVAVVALGVAAYAVVVWAHGTYRTRESAPFALLVSYSMLAIVVAIVIASIVLDQLVARRLRERALLDGSRFWIVVALGALVAALAPAWIASRVAPAAPIAAALVRSVLVVAVVLARMLRLGGRRRLWVAALAGVLAATSVLAVLGSAPRARSLLVNHGALAHDVAGRLWKLADRDGDGYAGSFGGADCDDGDPRRHPLGVDIAGNGIDENCTGADAPAAERAPARAAVGEQRNIVLVTVDSLRADHLSVYGYPRKTSPHLDAFAATATRFAWAITSCPSTYCAIPTLHIGKQYRYPSIFDAPSLAKIARDAGYETAAITCCERFAQAIDERMHFEILDATADTVRVSRIGQSNADAVADRALAWLARPRTRPYFLWLHFYEPHDPYAPPVDAGFGDGLVDRYDGEIAFVDRHIGRVLSTLDANTVVAITADHGEDLGEHGVYYHAKSLYEAAVRIPLIVRAPNAAPRVIETPVGLADVPPTLLELAGLATPAGMNGRSLAGAVTGGAAPSRPILVELYPNNIVKHDLIGAVDPPWYVVWDRRANAWSLFRLGDPDDVADGEPATLARMRRLLLELIDRETAVIHVSDRGAPR